MRSDARAAARALIDRTHLRIAAIQERLRSVPDRRVLMVVGHQPMVAVGTGTYLDELLTMARATQYRRRVRADLAPPQSRVHHRDAP